MSVVKIRNNGTNIHFFCETSIATKTLIFETELQTPPNSTGNLYTLFAFCEAWATTPHKTLKLC